MTPAAISLILQGILAAIDAAPKVVAIVDAGKNLISALAGNKLLTPEQQNALHAYVDAHAALRAAGITPPGWAVEPDPAP